MKGPTKLIFLGSGAMNPTTFETTVINGHIELPEGVMLPENTRVRVTVAEDPAANRVVTPRLAEPKQAADFTMEVTEASDAGV